jgi:23S rRNA pseudouridine2605 synthase
VSNKRGESGRRVQLHRALSKLGCGSRTQAWQWIEAGEVRVDGRIERNPLAWVDLGRQRITCKNREAVGSQPFTLAIHKPRGVVTTRSDERGRKTVYDLLPPGLPWIFPAGRLDADSEGLLILTNESTLSTLLTDPENHVPKVYQLTLRGNPTKEAVDRVRRGLILRDGPTRPARVTVLKEEPGRTVVEMELTEGRNRQARRMWSAVGHCVRRLVRVGIGGLPLGDLAPGAVRILGPEQVRQLTSQRPAGRARRRGVT